MSNFSSNLARLLEENNLTISKLASEIQITVSTLSKLVNGKIEDPRATTLKQIAQYFEISIDELLGVNFANNTSVLNNDSSSVPIYKIEQLNETKIPQTNQYKYIDIKNNDDEHFISYINSPAMYPLFDQNTMILFRRTNYVENLQFVLCRLHQTKEVVLRQIFIDGSVKVLKPINSDFNTIQLSELDEIIAVAIQIQRELL